MATFEKRKGCDGVDVWRVKVRRKGFRTQTSTFGRKTDAQNWASKIEVNIHARRHFPEHKARRHKLDATIDRYISYVKATKPKRLSLLAIPED